MSLRLTTRCCLALLCLLGMAAQAAPPALPDQFGNEDSLGNYPGESVLAIVVNVRKLRWVGKWEAALRKEMPGLLSIRVADITDQPPPEQDKIVELLQKRVPPNVPILIDMSNTWATTYELDTDEPCLLLFDADHNVVAQFRGRPKGKLKDEVQTALGQYFTNDTAEPEPAS
ncbi:MAG: hypothetical protein ACR2QG_06345 [Gammaproteobacteria bacterium]